MANHYLNTELFDRAVAFAMKAHANTERRGKGYPYSIHLMETVEIVATMTNDPELLAAAMLHDSVEDTEATLEELRALFGDRVAHLVDNESEKRMVGLDERASWHDRKREAIARLAASDRDSKMVAMGDKLSNMRAIARDYRALGDELWNRFHAPNGKPDHAWHYRELAAALSELKDTDAYQEFVGLVERTFA